MSSNLYEKSLYLNKDKPYLFNTEIIEYDIKSAGLNLCKEYKILSADKIRFLDNIFDVDPVKEKEKRVRQLGMYNKDKKISEALSNAFIDIRRRFFEDNSIEDDDILTIKKDAIFCLKKCKKTKFGDYIEFKEKHKYSSYMYINKMEFYYNDGKITVKGMSDECLEKHDEFMNDFLIKVFHKMETCEKYEVLGYVTRFISKYKNYKLPSGYYRRYDTFSEITLLNQEETFEDYFEDIRKEEIDIRYNYFNILVPLVKIIL